MWHDSIVDEVDFIRRTLLEQSGNDLDALMDRMARDGIGREGRVSSVEELNRLFPVTPVDLEAMAALGEPCRDPVVEEVHRAREKLGRDVTSTNTPRAKSA